MMRWALPLALLASLALPVRGGRTRAQPPHAALRQARYRVRGPGGGSRQTLLATWPAERADGRYRPVLIAFHGMGEVRMGPARGALAWTARYGLLAAYEALLGGALTAAHYGGLVREAHLAAVNAELARVPFKGLLVVGVYTPNLLARPRAAVDRYARWVAEQVLPKVREVWPVAHPSLAGVDGVSLGGMVALEVGLRYPTKFRSVGAIQPAVRGRTRALAERAQAAARVRPQRIRLLSSDRDPLLGVTRELSRALRARHVDHTLTVVPGGHDYAFNRGPGSLEMLRFHDLALRP